MRHSFLSQVVDIDRFQHKRILMVGAGGIGCELLKNLVLAGFKYIEIVDLDTIDLSNLNRQFLFQKQHIKKSKAAVARESALKFNPNVNIKAHHASIFDAECDLAWYKRFDLVLNALDNVSARSHVNLMCLASNTPLIESGTAGYHGQVTVHVKDTSACYDCYPKPSGRKTFPVCTIRSTPSEPIHCIVWGKSYLFSQLFGKVEEDDFDTSADADNAQELEKLKLEARALEIIRDSIGKPHFARDVFNKVFDADVRRVLTFDEIWKTRKAPTPLTFSQMQTKCAKTVVPLPTSTDFDQKVWTLDESFVLFKSSLDELTEEIQSEKSKDPTAFLEFDKDHDAALTFVTATANIRASVFGIPLKSRFEVKQMAGNIIPAIATTNAIAAGMIVMNAFKVLSGKLPSCRNTFVTYGGGKTHLLGSELLSKPNPACSVCSNNFSSIKIDLEKTTIGQFVEASRHKKNGFDFHGELSLSFGEKLLYDVDFDDNQDAILSSMGIVHGSRLTLVHEDDNDPASTAIVQVFVEHIPTSKALKFYLSGDWKPKFVPEPVDEELSTVLGKHKADDDEPTTSKKVKVDEDVVVIEDDDIIVL